MVGAALMCAGGAVSPITAPATEAVLRSLVFALRSLRPPWIAPRSAPRPAPAPAPAGIAGAVGAIGAGGAGGGGIPMLISVGGTNTGGAGGGGGGLAIIGSTCMTGAGGGGISTAGVVAITVVAGGGLLGLGELLGIIVLKICCARLFLRFFEPTYSSSLSESPPFSLPQSSSSSSAGAV